VRHGTQSKTDNAAYLVAQGAYEDALDDLLIGVRQNRVDSLAEEISGANATDQSAQREIKMLVRYTDVTSGKLYRVTYPTLDLSIAGLLTPGTDYLNRETTEVAAFESAFEAYVSSPEGNAVAIQSIQFVGRNS
jgi:hypothetical protein